MNVWENTVNQMQQSRPIATTQPQTYIPQAQPAQSNQFIWVNGRAMVDAWPIVANGQMTFIDPDAMKLWIKKADAYGRPFTAEEYDIVPVKQEEAKSTVSDSQKVDPDELQDMVAKEVEKAVSAKMAAIFSVKEEAHA